MTAVRNNKLCGEKTGKLCDPDEDARGWTHESPSGKAG